MDDCADDVLDAEYETLVPQPAPELPLSPNTNNAAALPDGLALLRRGGRHPEHRAKGAGAFWVAAFLIAAAAFWTSGGHAMVEWVVANREQASPLRITDLRSRLEKLGENQFLVVDGNAINIGTRAQVLPDLSINILSGNGRTARYFLGTTRQRLFGGERFSFSSRFAAPKDGVKSVSVTFRELSE